MTGPKACNAIEHEDLLILALERMLAAWDLHGLLTDWDGEDGWRSQARGHGHAGWREVDGVDVWLYVSTDHRKGIMYRDGDGRGGSATWAQVRQVLDRVPQDAVDWLTDALTAWRERPAGQGLSDWQRNEAGYRSRELAAALAACWVGVRANGAGT